MHAHATAGSLRALQTFFVFMALAAPIAARAKITIVSVTGASNSTIVQRGVTPPLGTPVTNNIYGGVAGPLSGTCSGSPLTTCNNCVEPSSLGTYGDNVRLVPCNTNRITQTTNVTIQFTSDTGTGYPAMVSVPNGTTTVAQVIQPTGTDIIPKGSTASLTLQWGTLCSSLVSLGTSSGTPVDANCASTGTGVITMQVKVGLSCDRSTLGSGSGSCVATAAGTLAEDTSDVINLTIGNFPADGSFSVAEKVVSASDTCDGSVAAPAGVASGVCSYFLAPGDSKALVKDVIAETNFPLEWTPPPNGIGNLPFKATRFFYVAGSGGGFDRSQFGQITPGTATIADLPVNPDGVTKGLTASRISGMSNGTRFYTKSAMVDMAGNVAFYQPDAGDTLCPNSWPLLATSPTECHTVTPSEVLGVLENDVNCFIATASYGSAFAPQVKVFRKFRDVYLKPTAWGRGFIRWYYAHSPKYARIIADSEALKFVSRAALAPFLGYAWLSLKIGALNAACLLAMLFALPLAGFRFASTKKRARVPGDWKRP